MKRIPLVLSLALLALPAMAQETYPGFTLGGALVARVDKGRILANRSLCRTLLLAPTCTQAEACVVEPQVTGGAACTSADALAAGRRIYPDSLAGRASFMTNELIRAQLPNYDAAWAAESYLTLLEFCKTNPDGVCTGSGQAAGCGVCSALK